MPDKLNQALIRNNLLVLDLFCKVDVLQNAIKLAVFLLYGNKGAFQLGGNIHFDMEQSRPAIAVILALPTRLTRHKEGAAVRGFVLKEILQFFRRQIILIFRFQFLAFLRKVIGQSLQKEHSENVLLKLRSVHFATENICRFQQMAFQLRYC